MTFLFGGCYYHFAYIRPRLRHACTWPKYLIAVADQSAILLIAFHTLRTLLFTVHVFIVAVYVYHCYILFSDQLI